MARTLHGIEKGIRLYAENSDSDFVDNLFGAGVPGTSGDTDAASIGSLYRNTTNGLLYSKVADTSSASDWQVYITNTDQTLTQATGVGAASVVLDSVLVDDVLACEWELHIREDSSPENIRAVKIWATHDGTAAADAVNVDDTAYGKLKIGANFTYTYTVELNGAAGAQVMRLSVVGSAGSALTFTARRNTVTAP